MLPSCRELAADVPAGLTDDRDRIGVAGAHQLDDVQPSACPAAAGPDGGRQGGACSHCIEAALVAAATPELS